MASHCLDKAVLDFQGRITHRMRNFLLVNNYIRVPIELVTALEVELNIGAAVEGVAERSNEKAAYVATKVFDSNRKATSEQDAIVIGTTTNVINNKKQQQLQLSSISPPAAAANAAKNEKSSRKSDAENQQQQVPSPPSSPVHREVHKQMRIEAIESVVSAFNTDRVSPAVTPLMSSSSSSSSSNRNRHGDGGGGGGGHRNSKSSYIDKFSRPRLKLSGQQQQQSDQLPTFKAGLKLPTHRVKLELPTNVLQCMASPEKWATLMPVLTEKLTAENYKDHFKTLLALEMASVDMRWQNLLVSGVLFTKAPPAQKSTVRSSPPDEHRQRARFSFIASSLHECVSAVNLNNVQRLLDENVYLYARQSTHHPNSTVFFEGFIDEIVGFRVYAVFDEDFNPNATVEYTVTFRSRHETLHRMYNAVAGIAQCMKIVYGPLLFEAAATSAAAAASSPPPQTLCKPSMLLWFNPQLSDEQKLAVSRICSGKLRPRPVLIYGPPGTGKTVTLVEAALQIATKVDGCKILLCAPSNAAADWLFELLHRYAAVGTAKLHALRLLSSGCCRAGSDRSMKHSDISSTKLFRRVALRLKDQSDILKSIARADICVATCSAMGFFFHFDESRRIFTHVFIDEAACASEPECSIPLLMLKYPQWGLYSYDDKNDRSIITRGPAESVASMQSSMREPYLIPQIVLAGDPQQLGAVIHYEDEMFSGASGGYSTFNTTTNVKASINIVDPLGQSLMERLLKLPLYRIVNGVPVNPHATVMLCRNYRSMAPIVSLVSELFYDNALLSAFDNENIENINNFMPNSLADEPHYSQTITLVTHDQPHSQQVNWPSLYNTYEVTKVVDVVARLLMKPKFNVSASDIGIITTYRCQADAITTALQQKLQSSGDAAVVVLPTIGTVQEFQGQERNVIILSTVRSQYQSKIEKSIRVLLERGARKSSSATNNILDKIRVNAQDKMRSDDDADVDAKWLQKLQTITSVLPEWDASMLGFVADCRRFNVAVTRARKKLFVIGNPYSLSMSWHWYRFMLAIEKQQQMLGGQGGVGFFHTAHQMKSVREFVRYLHDDVLAYD